MVSYGMYTLLATYVAKEPPPTRPHPDFRKSPENCGDELGQCAVAWGIAVQAWAICMRHTIPIETATPEGRGRDAT